MSHKSIVLVVVLFALLIIGMFVFAQLKNNEINEGVPPVFEKSKEKDIPYADITRIDAKHYFINGKHTFVGEINLPTPCDLLNTDILIMESYPEQVELQFSVINNTSTCVQSISTQRFKIEANVSPEATFSAWFMGREVALNLIPAAEGEVPEDFELFLKG